MVIDFIKTNRVGTFLSYLTKPVVDMENYKVLLSTKGITKRFGGVTAISKIDFSIEKAEVVGIVGDNGAGKSTFIKVLSGAFQPSSGEIYLEGKKVQIKNPRVARGMGIETVYQDLALIERMNVADNIFLGREVINSIAGIKFVDKRKMQKEAQSHLEHLGIRIESVKTEVINLSGGERQSTAVARAIFTSPKLVIMDEPTAALAVKEAGMVLELIDHLRDRGISVIIISHTLPHVFSVADRIIVFRHGEKIYETKIDETDENTVVKYITGA